MLDNSEIMSFDIDGISLRIDFLTRTLVNLDSNCTPTDEIVQLLGETSCHLREVDSQSSVCAIQCAPKIYSGECGRPKFEIKEEQLSFLIDQGFQVPVIAQLFRVSTRTIERRMTKYGLSISGRFSTTWYLNCYSHYVPKCSWNVISLFFIDDIFNKFEIGLILGFRTCNYNTHQWRKKKQRSQHNRP